MSAVLDHVLKEVEDNLCCCITKGIPDRYCKVHEIVEYLREKYEAMMSDSFDVEKLI